MWTKKLQIWEWFKVWQRNELKIWRMPLDAFKVWKVICKVEWNVWQSLASHIQCSNIEIVFSFQMNTTDRIQISSTWRWRNFWFAIVSYSNHKPLADFKFTLKVNCIDWNHTKSENQKRNLKKSPKIWSFREFILSKNISKPTFSIQLKDWKEIKCFRFFLYLFYLWNQFLIKA